MYRNANRSALIVGVASLSLLVVACKGNEYSELERDSALARDLARVAADSAVQPQLQDLPPREQAQPPVRAQRNRAQQAPLSRTSPSSAPRSATEPPSAAASSGGTVVTPSPAGSERPLAVIAAGTTLSLTASQKVCTNTHKVGDRFTATLAQAVSGSNGAYIPAGSPVTIEVTELHRSQSANDQIVMGFKVVSLAVGDKIYYPEAEVTTAQITRVRATSGSEDAKKVVGGAVAGAIIGQILGRDRKGTLIGAAAGAAAGGAAAAATADYDGCVDAGAPLTVKLTAPLSVLAGS
ncbi:MAG TPA: hypothetical protein VNL96_03870 [Gemmatimonadaceae bacterium]|nr:hypothetical protein [Gemmatimonadaceae bacterium]